MRRLFITLLAICIAWAPAHAVTTMDYAGSDGSFLLDSSGLNVKDYFYEQHCVDLSRSVAYHWSAKSQKWNNGVIGSENPATDTGGRTLSGLSAGPYYAALGGIDSATVTVANFGASTAPSTPGLPSGYSWLTGTWNPSDKGANITLSGGNLTAAWSTGWQLVRGTVSFTGSQKVCYGVLSNFTRNMVGIANSTASVNSYPGVDTNGYACYNLGSFPNWFMLGDTGVVCVGTNSDYQRRMLSTAAIATGNRCAEVALTAIPSGSYGDFGVANTSLPTQGKFVGEDTNSLGVGATASANSVVYYNNAGAGSAGAFTVGDKMMMCINAARTKFWVYNPTTAQWNDNVIGSQNPATDTGGIAPPSGTLYWAMSYALITGNVNTTWNFGAAAFSNTLPTGYCSQDATSCGGGGPTVRTRIFGANDNFPPVVDDIDRCRWAV